jgi:hypothetical protein
MTRHGLSGAALVADDVAIIRIPARPDARRRATRGELEAFHFTIALKSRPTASALLRDLL